VYRYGKHSDGASPNSKGALVATRAEVITHLRSFNDIEDQGDGKFRTEWDLGNGRTQLIFLFVADDFVVMTSPFAKEDDVTSSKALSLAAVFGICKVGDLYAFRHVVLIEDLDESELIHGIGYLAHAADGAESEVGGDRF
jgi:hypothetical protein